MEICTQDGCILKGTEKVTRGSEVWYYCKEHYKAWMRVMQAMGL